MKSLALGSVILGGIVPSAPLPHLSENLALRAIKKDFGEWRQTFTTLSAGRTLTHVIGNCYHCKNLSPNTCCCCF